VRERPDDRALRPSPTSRSALGPSTTSWIANPAQPARSDAWSACTGACSCWTC